MLSKTTLEAMRRDVHSLVEHCDTDSHMSVNVTAIATHVGDVCCHVLALLAELDELKKTITPTGKDAK